MIRAWIALMGGDYHSARSVDRHVMKRFINFADIEQEISEQQANAQSQ